MGILFTKRSGSGPLARQAAWRCVVSAPCGKGEVYGYLALIKLYAIAAVDDRITPSQRRVLVLLGSYAGPDGTCCVAVKRIADKLRVTPQAVQAPSRALEKAGYFRSERRKRPIGAEGAKVYIFNLEMGAKDACPFFQPNGPATSDPCTPRQPPVSAREQPPEVAHKKPPEETCIEETSATRREQLRPGKGRAIGSRSVHNEICEQGAGARQPSLQPRIAEGQTTGPPVEAMEDRIAAYNLDRGTVRAKF